MPINEFETALSGGHPNSLGNTVAVTDQVLGSPSRLRDLLDCYRSEDAVVRLRVSSCLKRVSGAHPEWLVPYLDELLGPVAAIDQASTQWTLAILIDRLDPWMTARQRGIGQDIMTRNLLQSEDWIVQNTTMNVIAGRLGTDERLRDQVLPRIRELSASHRTSVSARARAVLDRLVRAGLVAGDAAPHEVAPGGPLQR